MNISRDLAVFHPLGDGRRKGVFALGLHDMKAGEARPAQGNEKQRDPQPDPAGGVQDGKQGAARIALLRLVDLSGIGEIPMKKPAPQMTLRMNPAKYSAIWQ